MDEGKMFTECENDYEGKEFKLGTYTVSPAHGTFVQRYQNEEQEKAKGKCLVQHGPEPHVRRDKMKLECTKQIRKFKDIR